MDWKKVMVQFWDERARDNAAHFIATDVISYNQHDIDAFFASGEEQVRRCLTEIEYTPGKDTTMLEIGCGIGRMTRAFASRFGTVYGIDISPEMINRGRRYLADCPNVYLSVSSGTNLSQFADSSIDFCFSYIVFQHIPDPAITLGYIYEMGRVLKPGGVAYFQVNTSKRPLSTLRRWLRLRARLQRAFGQPDYASPAWSGSSLREASIRQALKKAGLRLERLSGVGTQYTWVLCRRNELKLQGNDR